MFRKFSQQHSSSTHYAQQRNSRRKSVLGEKYDPTVDTDDHAKVIHPKSDEERKRLVEASRDVFLLKFLDSDQLSDVLDAMFERNVLAGEHVIDQGDDGDNFYVIDSGIFHSYVDVDGGQKHVGTYTDKGSFGELSLMYNTHRSATIIAKSDGKLWCLDRTNFNKIILKSAYVKRKNYETFLESVPILQSLTEYERISVADALVPKVFTDGQCIIKQGEPANGMYLIETGTVKVSVQTQRKSILDVATLTRGQYFGEVALVTHQPRTASVFAVGDVKLAFLDTGAFERLLGSCVEVMKRNKSTYEHQLNTLMTAELNFQSY